MGSVALSESPNLSGFQPPLGEEKDNVTCLAGIMVRIWNQVYTYRVSCPVGRGGGAGTIIIFIILMVLL